MKKNFLVLLLAGALSLSLLAGCGGQEPPAPTDNAGGQTQTTPAPDPAPSDSHEPEQTPETPDASQEPQGQPDETPSPSQSPAQPDKTPTPSQTPAQPEQTPSEPTPEATPTPEEPAAGASLPDFYAEISSAYELPGMMEITSDIVPDIYPGLESLSLKQQVLYMAAITSVASEIAMVEAADADTAAQAAAIFQARIDAQVAGGAWYPETIENWSSNSQVVTCGNFVLLVVDPSYAQIAADFESFVK